MELLVPGAVAAGTGPSSNVTITSFNGVAGTSNNYKIDGSDYNDYFHATSNAMPPVENMAEFSVTSSQPDASFGRSAGGQITAVLKSGTNELHGQAWVYLHNGGWNANSWSDNWLNISRPTFSQRWYGFNTGGPVFIPKFYNGKNKTFFFTSYERTSTAAATVSTGQTITNAERQGDFSNSPDGIPVLNGVPTPNIAPAYFSTLGKTLMTNTDIMPAPTSGLDTFTWEPLENEVVQHFLAKIDHYFSPKHRLFGSLWWSRDVASDPDLFFKFAFASADTQYPNKNLEYTWPVKTQIWTLNDTYTISPTTLNNFILGVTRYSAVFSNTAANNPLFGDKEVGVSAVGDLGAPNMQQITTPRGMGYGIYNGYTNYYLQNFVYATDHFTVIRGRHTWKMGFEFRNYRELFQQAWESGGGLGFADGRQTYGATGNGIADMMLGLGSNFYQNNTEHLNNTYPAREAYVQDAIKLSPRLTVTLAARWEPHFGVRAANGDFSAFRPGQSSTIFPTAPVGLVVVGDQGVPGNTYGTRWGNIGPRASFAWDIFGNGRASIRAGYAWMTDYQYLQIFNQFTTTFPYGISYTPPIDSLANLSNPYAQYESSGGGAPFPFTAPKPGDPGNTKLQFPNPLNTLGFDSHYNSGQIQQWNATFDLEPIRSYLISVGYVATRGTHLSETHNLDWPQFVPGTSANTTANIYSREPYYTAGFNTISEYFADWNSMYNSLQVRFTKRYSYGLTFSGNYTLSSSRTQNGCRYYGNCSLDYYSPGLMQSTAMSFVYDLPIPPGRTRLSKALIGGWTLGGVITGSSGQYGSVGDYSCAQFNFGSASCTATFVGGSPYAANQGKPTLAGGAQVGVAWLNPNSFIRGDQVLVNGVATTPSTVGQRLFLGNATTGVYKGPAVFMLNASLSKTFSIFEKLKLNYRLEALNALNHTVLLMPGSTTVSPNMTQFGAITSAMSPRQLQMSAHVVF